MQEQLLSGFKTNTNWNWHRSNQWCTKTSPKELLISLNKNGKAACRQNQIPSLSWNTLLAWFNQILAVQSSISFNPISIWRQITLHLLSLPFGLTTILPSPVIKILKHLYLCICITTRNVTVIITIPVRGNFLKETVSHEICQSTSLMFRLLIKVDQQLRHFTVIQNSWPAST